MSQQSLSSSCRQQHQQRLVDQRILVTGAGRGIGQAIALICHKEGAKVAISSRTSSELDETIALAKKAAEEETDSTSSDNDIIINEMDPYIADVTNPKQVDSMVERIVKKWGRIDILINNAGRGQTKKGNYETLVVDESGIQEFQNLLLLNVISVQIVTSSVLKQSMLLSEDGGEGGGKGKIINISSKAGKVGLPTVSHYVASKFALEGMTASLAAELKDTNIQVNTISPGMVNTRSFPKPEGRKGVRSAESIKDGLMALLMDDEITGHYLHVDELDQVRRLTKGLNDNNGDRRAMKPINEPTFDP